MLEDGYAAVTYRNVAARAGASVWRFNYFPTLDSLFAAVLQRYSERTLQVLNTALRDDPGDVLGILWDYSSDEVSTALLMEFMALANHRKSIHAEIAAFAAQYREIQLDALTTNWEKLELSLAGESVTPAAIALLITCLPKWMQLEDSFGMSRAMLKFAPSSSTIGIAHNPLPALRGGES